MQIVRNHWNPLVPVLPLHTLPLGLPCALLAACVSHKIARILCETQAARDAREPKGKVGRGKVGTREFQ